MFANVCSSKAPRGKKNASYAHERNAGKDHFVRIELALKLMKDDPIRDILLTLLITLIFWVKLVCERRGLGALSESARMREFLLRVVHLHRWLRGSPITRTVDLASSWRFCYPLQKPAITTYFPRCQTMRKIPTSKKTTK